MKPSPPDPTGADLSSELPHPRALTPGPSPAPSHPPSPGEGNPVEAVCFSPSSPGEGGWEGAGEEGRGDEGLGKGGGRSPREVAREVLETEAAAIRGLLPQLDERFDRAVALLRACTGRVVCTGMGKSGLILKKIAATLASTGTPAFFLHPAEAVHGDLGMIVPGDVVLAASYSGTTEELLRLVETLKRLGIPLVVMTASSTSPLARHADVHLPVAIDREACPLNLAPTASTTATLALGDALAMALHEARGFTREDFALLHPAGQLGKRLLKVEQLMHAGDALPKVTTATPMREAIYEMSKKGLGITAVVADGDRLVGCISDGDLRRLLQEDDGTILGHTAGERMTRNPRTIRSGELAAAALKVMEDHRITSLFVCDEAGRLEGIVHLHDLWGLELF
ncbi:MAG: KpsF/GutQ family sugar-phosphate isomerase [Acidobacteria bacterium]|nr:KpsF/GutQ family sugar-phosphate isomerase [Acidobacteriota bacterium]